ncbi:apolipoprotein N-acyltransferase [Qipengyuania nanhaisediminis]|uniref:apolipoprotein N-acyltransferase n=1 Tax=Qipengyuania nanhaisediminis TaxID=604088 RepID=UPI0038B3CD8D
MNGSARAEGQTRIAALAARLAGFAQSWPATASGLLGLVAAFGYPPFHAWWLALPALALWIILVRAAPDWRSAAWLGWVFGWAHLTLANNWIATAFTYQSEMPSWLGWFAVPLLCLYLAIYPAMAAAIARAISGRGPLLSFGALLAGGWIVTEWLRSWVFTGYPWPPLGLLLLGRWDAPGLAGVLPWMGTYGLSGLVLLLASALAWLAVGQRWWRMLIVSSLVTLGMLLPGFVTTQTDAGIPYRLVQPLILQEELNDGSKFEEQFQRIAGLTVPGNRQSRLVLWPESALPDYLEPGYPMRYYQRTTLAADPAIARARIAQVIGPRSTLLTGVVNLNMGEREDGSIGAVGARNSVVAIGGDGAITHEYAKAHLVPYGEYLPMEDWLGAIGLSRLTAGSIPYIPGPGPRTIDLGEHGRAGVQICYEIVFSGQVVDRDDRPDFIFNPSNDGWFGYWGPPQHLAQARMRAIEEGLPVLRSTTTGISAVIDARGNVLRSIARGQAAAVEGIVPAAREPTLFARLGNALPLGWAGILFVLGLGLPRLLALRPARG